MRDLLLYASGTLGLAAAFVHGWLGETQVFARARIEPERLRRLIRLVWHCSVVDWTAMGVLLILAPTLASGPARSAIIGASVTVYAAGAVGNAIASRGRHFGWAWLTVVVGLALAGL